MFNRRTATRVKNGRVQRKNRHRPTGHDRYVLLRDAPGRGFRHVVTRRDVQSFIDIIPDWERYSERLEHIILASCDGDWDGLHCMYPQRETGSIYLHAWSDDFWIESTTAFYADHRDLLLSLGVSCDEIEDGYLCRFTEAQARAYMLLHVFMHELGHHYDKLHQKHHGASRGEDYAEKFATSRFQQLYPAYVRVFGDPARSQC